MVLNVGDKILIKKNLVVNKSYGKSKTSFIAEMKRHEGKLVTISKVYQYDDDNHIRYSIAEDGSYWVWVIEMFEVNQEQEEIWF